MIVPEVKEITIKSGNKSYLHPTEFTETSMVDHPVFITIHCNHKPILSGRAFRKVKIKITAGIKVPTGRMIDSIHCLESQENGCKNKDCIAHCRWGNP